MIDINELRLIVAEFRSAGQPMTIQASQMEELLDRLEAAQMSLRDYFAAKAMQALLTTIDEFPDEHWRTGVAMDAYAMADAMLKAREASND